MGDDLAVVRLGPDGVEVAGIARLPAVPGDLGSHVLSDARPLPGDHRNRWELPPHRLVPGWFRVDGVVLAGHSPRPMGELARWQPQDVIETVLRCFTSTMSPPKLRLFFACAAALTRLPALKLGLGTDPANRLADVGELLERLSPDDGREPDATRPPVLPA